MTVWRDNFNRASLGTTAPNGATWGGSGTWSIVSNELHSPTTFTPGVFFFLVADWGAADIDMQITCRNDPGYDASGLTVRWVDANNWVRFCADTSAGGGTRYLQQMVAGTLTTVSTDTGYGDPDNHILRIVVRGDYYRCFEDNGGGLGLVFDWTDPSALNLTCENHGVMWATSTGGVSHLDDLVVSDLRGGFRLGKLGFGNRGGFS